MFSVRFTRQQGIPAATLVASAVALATLTAGCGASASSSSAAALSAAAGKPAATGAGAVSPASAAASETAGASEASAAGKPAGAGVAKPAGASKAAGVSQPAGPGMTAGAGEPAGAGNPGGEAGSGKLTGADATALLSQAIANTRASASVQVTGQAVRTGTSGQTESFDLTLVRDQGCEGAVTMSPTRSFKVVATGGYVWMMPSDAYYASMHMSQQSRAQVENKYIRMRATNGQVTDLATVCTFSGLLGSLGKPAGAPYLAVPATYGAAPGYRVTEAGRPGTSFITKAPAPLLQQITDQQPNGGSITFTDYNSTSAITIPAAAETIDGTS
jgi:hypothetical protein